MCLAQNDNVIQTLAPDRSDQPFGKAILPRRSWYDRLVPNAHGAQSACDDGTIDAIPVPDHGVAVLLFEIAVAIAVSGYALYMTFNGLAGFPGKH
jgi:hypothetical protein